MSEKEPNLLVRSPRPLPRPGKGEPPMDVERLRAYSANPTPTTEKFAAELLARCGPLVVDELQYRLTADGQVEALTREQVGQERMRAIALQAKAAAEASRPFSADASSRSDPAFNY